MPKLAKEVKWRPVIHHWEQLGISEKLFILNGWNPKLSPNSYYARYTREYQGS